MKFIKVNKRKIIFVVITGFVLVSITGCKQEIVKKESDTLELGATQIEQPTEEQLVIDGVSPIIVEEEKPTEEIEESTVISSFKNIEEEVNLELTKEANETTKNKMKQNFITAVDFVFYGTEINGYTFEELTEKQKQDVLQIIDNMDQKIMKKYPTYKEDISSTTKDALHKASELIKQGASNIKEFTKDKLGDDNYDAIKNAPRNFFNKAKEVTKETLGEDNYSEMIECKDKLIDNTINAAHMIGDTAVDSIDKGKEKVKNWYENFKKAD